MLPHPAAHVQMPPPSTPVRPSRLLRRRNAISWVKRFSQGAFARKFRILSHRGVLTKPFRHLIAQTTGAWLGVRGAE